MKRWAVVCAAVGAVALVTMVAAVPAASDPLAIAGCGKGWRLGDLGEVFDAIDKRIYDDPVATLSGAIAAADGNGDGFLCYRQAEPNRGQDRYWGAEDYIVTFFIDNHAVGQTR